MADSNPSSGSQGSSSSSSGKGGFLSRKVFGIPLWVIVLIIVAAYYWYTHYGPGKKTTQQPKQGQGRGRGRGGGGTRVIIVRGGGGRHRHPKASPRASSAPGGNVGGGMAAAQPLATGAPQISPTPVYPTGGPVDADTGAPVYARYAQYYGAGAAGGDGAQADGSVPAPMMAYAPMTGGGIYG